MSAVTAGSASLARSASALRAWGQHLLAAPRWLWLLAASGWLTWLGLLLPAGSPIRVLLVLGFVLTCPGLAVSLLLPVREAVVRWVLAVALSMSLALLLTTALTVVSNGSLPLRLAVLASITTIAALLAAPSIVAPATPAEAEDIP